MTNQSILIIEDDPALRTELGAIFEIEGWHVLVAEDGAIGLQMAIREQPCVVLSDINLPGLDGFGVLGGLRGRGLLQTIEVFLMSGGSDAATIERKSGLSRDRIILKPFDVVALLGSLSQVCENRSMQTPAL